MRRVLPLLLVAACAQDFADLAPFPCPTDRRCPDGLVCVPELGCAPARPDAPCPAVGECADTSGDDLVCWQSLCERPCASACPNGRRCVAGVCLLDCTGEPACPSPLECKTYDLTATSRVCMPASLTLPACTAAAVGDSCLLCGAGDFTVLCPVGGYCASNSTCAENNTCNCNVGYHAVTCDGTACSGETPCPYPDWHCVPNLWSVGCDGTSDAYALHCTCVDGTTTFVPCNGGSCENACLDTL